MLESLTSRVYPVDVTMAWPNMACSSCRIFTKSNELDHKFSDGFDIEAV